MIVQTYQDLHRFRYVTYSYVTTNLKLRYRRSFLGFVWTALAPILQYLVMGLVLSQIVRSTKSDYITFYLSGAIFFSLFASILTKSSYFFLQNENFIRKLAIPKIIFIVNGVAYETINFFISFSAILALGILLGRVQLWSFSILALIPVLLAPFLLFGLACMISTLTVYFRDLLHIVPVCVQALFFLTPIAYDLEMVPEKFHSLIHLNPIALFIQAFRAPLIEQQIPDASTYFILFAISMTFFIAGCLIVRWQDNKIIFKL